MEVKYEKDLETDGRTWAYGIIFTTALIILGNLVADVLYCVIDPRIRTE